MITVLVIEPGKIPEIRKIEDNLKTMQEIVGGWIEASYPFGDEVCIICNEEGKLDGLPLNRGIEENGDIIAGTFLLVGTGKEGESVSLTPEQLEKYFKRFEHVEIFEQTPEGLMWFRGMFGEDNK